MLIIVRREGKRDLGSLENQSLMNMNTIYTDTDRLAKVELLYETKNNINHNIKKDNYLSVNLEFPCLDSRV